ncbi:hypothetical protein WAI453_005741 [Rhynchosporium graminicola]|uniref:SWR1-complex protein 4 n=1 Tax=Rhynchosporium graminicola TaxID=2792576 RepID=A0A1E1KKL5_9HELO|nr:related to SWC4 SWr Complex member [Rhynchosporium commune]
MTSHDVREMLDLPGEAGPRPVKKQKLSAPRPVLKGLAREIQNLSGDNPIAIVPEIPVFRKKKFGSRKPAAKWENRGFTNSARNGDGLVLHHWRRKAEVIAGSGAEEGGAEQATKPEPPLEDSTFAKYNVHVNTPQYTDEQYKLVLQSNDWTKHETDYLLQLVQDYDLRWPVIWDRYEYQAPIPEGDGEPADNAMIVSPKGRTMEEMKARYYAVAAAMMKVNTKPEVMTSAEFNLLGLMEGYDPVQEENRKKFAESAFSRTIEEAKEEESLLVELKRILARSEKLNAERHDLYQLLDSPASTGAVGIYNSSAGLSGLFQQLMNADKTKKRKSLMGVEGVSPAPGPSGPSQQANSDRRDSNIRESISGPSGGGAPNNKKGPAQPQSDRRVLTPQEEEIYGVKRFDRITTSGPSFRHEKIKKPIMSKSQTQQAKINNVLAELGVTTHIFMPTFAVGEAFDNLLTGVNLLLDQKKHLDKLQGELNLARSLKSQRERDERIARGEPEPEPEAQAEAESAADHQIASAEKTDEASGERNVKVEEESEKSAGPAMGGVSGTHKRSASVLSAVSDKDAKRQKK